MMMRMMSLLRGSENPLSSRLDALCHCVTSLDQIDVAAANCRRLFSSLGPVPAGVGFVDCSSTSVLRFERCVVRAMLHCARKRSGSRVGDSAARLIANSLAWNSITWLQNLSPRIQTSVRFLLIYIRLVKKDVHAQKACCRPDQQNVTSDRERSRTKRQLDAAYFG